MPIKDIELNPVDHITADAIGSPGQRVFYLQGWKGNHIVTLIIEKVQLQTLAVGVEQFLAEIRDRFSILDEASDQYSEEKMHIDPPVDPVFRVGELALSYDSSTDRVILLAREIALEEKDLEDAGVVRFFCSRSQIRALSKWGLEIASRGRPLCPYCNQPMEPEGHVCPKKNGKH